MLNANLVVKACDLSVAIEGNMSKLKAVTHWSNCIIKDSNYWTVMHARGFLILMEPPLSYMLLSAPMLTSLGRIEKTTA